MRQTTAFRDTSAQCFHSLPAGYFTSQDDRIFFIVSNDRRSNMSMREIEAAYKSRYEEIDYSSLSRSLNSLVKKGRLVRLPTKRECSFSHVFIHPVSVPKGQLELL
jgi:hypothetical protein